jgi:hypothetical protein
MKTQLTTWIKELAWRFKIWRNGSKRHPEFSGLMGFTAVDTSIKSLAEYQTWIQSVRDPLILSSLFNATCDCDGAKPQHINVYTKDWYHTALEHNSAFVINAIAIRWRACEKRQAKKDNYVNLIL